MARAILFIAGGVWLLAAATCIGLALGGVDWLVGILPPLAIDEDAVARTLAALGSAAAVVGVSHLVIGGGVRRDRTWALSAGILLAAGAAVGFIALAAAALTSALAGTMHGLAAVGAAIGAVLASGAYGAAGASMVHRLRSGGAG